MEGVLPGLVGISRGAGKWQGKGTPHSLALYSVLTERVLDRDTENSQCDLTTKQQQVEDSHAKGTFCTVPADNLWTEKARSPARGER